MNLGQLRDATYANLGTDPNDGLLTPKSINGFLNRALHKVEQESDWPWLETQETLVLTTGVDSYTPGSTSPAGTVWLRTRFMLDDTERVVEWQTRMQTGDRWRKIDSHVANQGQSTVGKPIEFSIYADQIIFRPIPDNTYYYNHLFQQAEKDLVLDTDTPIIPATYHNGIIEFASYLAFRSTRESERANLSFQGYNEELKKMKERAKRRIDLPGKVRVRPNSWL